MEYNEIAVIRDIKYLNSQKHYIWTLIFLLAFNPIISFVNTVTNIFIYQGFTFDTIIVYLLLLVLISKSIFQLVSALNYNMLITILVTVSVFTFTFLFLPDNFRSAYTSFSDLSGNPLYYSLFAFIGYLILTQISLIDLLVLNLIKTSKILIPMSIINYILLFNQGIIAEYMVISYDSLLFIAIALIGSLHFRDFKLGIIGIIGLLFIFFTGARGPIISLLLTFIFYFLFSNFSRSKKTLILTILVLGIIVLWVNLDHTLSYLDNLFYNIGLQSRNLSLYFEDELTNDSGRAEIQNSLINKMTLFGHGIFGDRVVTGYAHNLFIEIFFQWGILLGSVLSVIILYIIYRGMKTNSNYLQFLIIVFLSTGFFKLQFSGSYLTEINFYLLIAFCQKAISFSKYNINFKTQPTRESSLAN